MKEQKVSRKRSSKKAIYTLLFLLLFVSLVSLFFTVYTYGQLTQQNTKFEGIALRQNDAVEDINLKLNDLAKNAAPEKEIENSSNTKDDLDVDLKELEISAVESSSSSRVKTFKDSSFPFTFSYNSTWSLITESNPLKISGQEISEVAENEVKLLSPEDKTYVNEAVELGSSDFVNFTTSMTYFADEDIDTAIETYYGSVSDAERVEVMRVGAYQVEVYQGSSGITESDDYFVKYDSGTIVVSVTTAQFAEEIIKTIE